MRSKNKIKHLESIMQFLLEVVDLSTYAILVNKKIDRIHGLDASILQDIRYDDIDIKIVRPGFFKDKVCLTITHNDLFESFITVPDKFCTQAAIERYKRFMKKESKQAALFQNDTMLGMNKV